MRSRAVRNYNSNSSAIADDARARGRREEGRERESERRGEESRKGTYGYWGKRRGDRG